MTTALKDAWRTIVPDLADRHGPLPPIMVTLTVLTGLVDAFSYLVLGHVFVANMTGNVVFIAFSLAGSPDFSLLASLVSLVSFALGALVGGSVGHRSTHRGRHLVAVLVLETVLVLVAFGVAELAPQSTAGVPRYVLIVLLGLAMGAQNAAARSLAVPDLTTTVLTLTITGLAADGRWLGGPGSKVGRRLLATLSMFLGALVGAVVALHGPAALTLLIGAALLVALSGCGVAAARSTRAWTRPV